VWFLPHPLLGKPAIFRRVSGPGHSGRYCEKAGSKGRRAAHTVAGLPGGNHAVAKLGVQKSPSSSGCCILRRPRRLHQAEGIHPEDLSLPLSCRLATMVATAVESAERIETIPHSNHEIAMLVTLIQEQD
jgi:hypothetical protein